MITPQSFTTTYLGEILSLHPR